MYEYILLFLKLTYHEKACFIHNRLVPEIVCSYLFFNIKIPRYLIAVREDTHKKSFC